MNPWVHTDIIKYIDRDREENKHSSSNKFQNFEGILELDTHPMVITIIIKVSSKKNH